MHTELPTGTVTFRGGALLDEQRPGFVGAGTRGRELDLWDATAIALGEDDQTVP